ncbi:Titin [Labeo rohita]|uniref:Titin n=1 Tax=Labeo rohita TaxID=84645 RepID=A0ABQ8L448_LABRO|nr:Titin [Labeo rohita]
MFQWGMRVLRTATAHCTATEGEQCLDLGHLNMEQDLIDFTEDIEMELPTCPEQSVCLELSTCLNFPPTLPLLFLSSSPAASALPPLFPDSPSAHPQPIICAVGSQMGSPPSPIGPPAPPGSLVPPALPWSVVIPPSPQDSTPPAAPCHSVPPAPLASSLPPGPPQSSVASAPPLTSRSPPQSSEPWAPPWPSRSLVSHGIIGSPSPPRAPPPSAPPPSVGPLESSALPPLWLLPPSAPPWATIMAAAWVSPGSSCSGSLLSPPWVLPPLDPPWILLSPPWSSLRRIHPGSFCLLLGSSLRRHHPGLCLLSSQESILCHSLLLHSFVFVLFYSARSCLPGEGVMSHPCGLFMLVSPSCAHIWLFLFPVLV